MNRYLQRLVSHGLLPLLAVSGVTHAQGVWSAAEVAKASGREQCRQTAAVPKKLKQRYTLGFVNPNKGHPFFGVWSQAMRDASRFYGVNFVEADAAGDKTKELSLLETLMVRKPQVVGNGGSGPDTYEALAARAQDANVPFLGIDNGPSDFTPYVYGVPDATIGKMGAEVLAKAVQTRMQNSWKGKQLYFVEFTHNGVSACVTRTGAAARTFKSLMKLSDQQVLKVDVSTGQSAADGIKAILAAHPNAAFAMIPCWDALGFEPYNAAKDAGREKDVMLFTLGGDKPSADLLVKKPQGYVGYIEFQPYCEAWGWVENAISILEGRPVRPFQARRVTLQADIERRYRELYGQPR